MGGQNGHQDRGNKLTGGQNRQIDRWTEGEK